MKYRVHFKKAEHLPTATTIHCIEFSANNIAQATTIGDNIAKEKDMRLTMVAEVAVFQGEEMEVNSYDK